jgi:predicted CoA-binding protein/ferredoxin-thioredoxin reductase catalytic subunit
VDLRRIFLSYHTIVVVGCSRHPGKPSYDVPRMMKEHGFRIVCVNPLAEDPIMNSPTYHNIRDVPDSYLEIVDVFRPSREIPILVREMLKYRKIPKVFWLQEGIKHVAARELLEPLGVTVVEDRCILKSYLAFLSKRDEIYRQILTFVRSYARARGFALHPDPDKLDEIVLALAENQRKYGYRYCPCREITGNFEEDKKKICPCVWHEEEIRRDGHCRCGLFWDPKRIKAPGGI